MNDLTEQSLEDVLREIHLLFNSEEPLCFKPSKIILIKHPEETDDEWNQRCESVRQLSV